MEVLSACTISILSENMLHNSSVFSMELIYKIVILCNITKFFTVQLHLVILMSKTRTVGTHWNYLVE